MSEPTVAVLYADPKGVYASLPGVDLWDEARDARLYAGPYPVVAHPPCQRWCALMPVLRARWGYQIGDDGGCFASALAAVRRFGGVLEHPAQSFAWARFDLHRPTPGGWAQSFFDDGWVTEVSQVAYGHRARKRTWLYYVGPDPPSLNWGEPAATAKVSGMFGLPAGEYVADEARRVRPREAASTPPAFRDVLLGMARTSTQAAVQPPASESVVSSVLEAGNES